MCHVLCISVLLPFSSQKDFFISTWSNFAIYLFKVTLPVLALLYGYCPLSFKLRSFFAFPQKLLSSQVLCKKRRSWRFRGFRVRATVLQSLFNKATSLRAYGFIEERLQRGCFSSAHDSFCFSVTNQTVCKL